MSKTKIDTKEIRSRDADEGAVVGPGYVVIDNDERDALCDEADFAANIRSMLIIAYIQGGLDRADGKGNRCGEVADDMIKTQRNTLALAKASA